MIALIIRAIAPLGVAISFPRNQSEAETVMNIYDDEDDVDGADDGRRRRTTTTGDNNARRRRHDDDAQRRDDGLKGNQCRVMC